MTSPAPLAARRRALRARLAVTTRHHPDRVDDLHALRAEAVGLGLEAAIVRALDADPPPTSADRRRLAALLAPAELREAG